MLFWAGGWAVAQMEIASSDRTEFAWIKLLLSDIRAVLLFTLWSAVAPRSWRCWWSLVVPGGGSAFPKEPTAPAPLRRSEAGKMNVCGLVKMLLLHHYLPLVKVPETNLCHTNFRDQSRKSEFAETKETLLSPAYF